MTLTCPQCRKPFETDRSWPGHLVPCPNCGHNVDLERVETGSPSLLGGDRPLKADAELAEGTLIGQYRVERLIGRGGMGAVYQGRHTMLDRAVAIKVLPPDFAADVEFVARFKREAMALAKLQHPNIVTIHDMGVQGELYYFVMEFVEGVDLRHLLVNKQLPPEQALQIVPKLCDALEYAHGQGIVHRDIKPENIMLDARGEPKIADFGLAKVIRGDRGRTLITSTNVVMGTADYMAPEQREVTKQADHRADIFSLGVVFYEMLTGELPVGKWDLPSRKVQVDVRLDEIVVKALEANPERRYQRAAHMGTDVTRLRTAPPPAPAKPGSAVPAWTIFGCLIALMVPVVILVLAFGGSVSISEFAVLGSMVMGVVLLFGAVAALAKRKGTGVGVAAGCGVAALVGLGLLILLPIITMKRSERVREVEARVEMEEAMAAQEIKRLEAEVEGLLQYDPGVDPTYRLAQAEDLCDKMDQESVITHRLMGRIEQEHGRRLESIGASPLEKYSDSVGDFTRALHIEPDDFQSHLGRGQTHFLMARYLARQKLDASRELTEATNDLIRAAQIDPDSANAWLWLGTVYADRGQSKDAEEKYSVAVRKAPQSAEPLIRRAQARMALGNYKGAVEDFEKAFRLDASLNAGAVQEQYAEARTKRGEDF